MGGWMARRAATILPHFVSPTISCNGLTCPRTRHTCCDDFSLVIVLLSAFPMPCGRLTEARPACNMSDIG